MPFANDRRLLVLEPNLFRDVEFASALIASGTDGVLSGTSFTSASADFEAAGVDAGHVISLSSRAVEVIQRVSATELIVSLLRARVEDDPLPPPDGVAIVYTVRSFSPQIETVHRQVMRMAGIEPDAADAAEGEATVEAVLNADEMGLVEALGSLEMIFAAAASILADEPYLRLRAASYRERFASARQRVRVRLDLDGDGVSDVMRSLSAVQFVRW